MGDRRQQDLFNLFSMVNSIANILEYSLKKAGTFFDPAFYILLLQCYLRNFFLNNPTPKSPEPSSQTVGGMGTGETSPSSTATPYAGWTL